MSGPDPHLTSARLRLGLVLRVREQACEIAAQGGRTSARYATGFPTPHVERVSPGNLVAVATAPDGAEVIVWRWYDAVVLGQQDGWIQLWEPAHGDVLARPRPQFVPSRPGARAYASAGLPGADWWVAGPAVDAAADALVELDAVDRLYTDHDLWKGI